jgi:hypothetical protein
MASHGQTIVRLKWPLFHANQKKMDGTIDALFDYRMLGKLQRNTLPRWSIIRDVLLCPVISAHVSGALFRDKGGHDPWRQLSLRSHSVRERCLEANRMPADCNCSICAKSSFLQASFPSRDSRSYRKRKNLNADTFNIGVARRLFCGFVASNLFTSPSPTPTRLRRGRPLPRFSVETGNPTRMDWCISVGTPDPFACERRVTKRTANHCGCTAADVGKLLHRSSGKGVSR